LDALAFFRIGFEILFSHPQELVDLISDLERTLRNTWGGCFPHIIILPSMGRRF